MLLILSTLGLIMFVVTWRCVKNAPEGYEQTDGFHYGVAHGRHRRRARAAAMKRIAKKSTVGLYPGDHLGGIT